MHLEILKIFKFKVENKRHLGINHVFLFTIVAFIVRFYNFANSGQLSYAGLQLVGLHLVHLHLVGLSLTTHLAYLSLKTIILDPA